MIHSTNGFSSFTKCFQVCIKTSTFGSAHVWNKLVLFFLHSSRSPLTVLSFVLSLNLLLLCCVFLICPGLSVMLRCSPPTLFNLFWKDTFGSFFFFLLLSFLLCNTLELLFFFFIRLLTLIFSLYSQLLHEIVLAVPLPVSVFPLSLSVRPCSDAEIS